ncbi:hypothetical protein OG806_08285 [Streptomyces sp. NBC_00882]|uniref:hypothetical protein n=1 Tax=Streptomyces sp. NBC_00882 TaxID=2975856 RepID=UPI0038707BAB|nr:hypothetical protein OG806_08285 [Streptomyces sp. NBC_00882]
MDLNSLRKLVEGQLLRLEGNAFQECMDRLGLELYPGDYQPVRAAGPKGDTKNDGYCPKARVFFAAHATRGERIDKTKAKIRGDLEGCLQEHRDVRVWRFLTNDTLPGEVDQFIDNELRPLYRGVTIEVWGLKRLADEISKLKRDQVNKIIDVVFHEAKTNENAVQVVQLNRIKSGRDLWPILSTAQAWMPPAEPDDCTDDEQDLVDGVIQTFIDWLEISEDVEMSRSGVRDAQRGIDELLQELRDKGLTLYSGTGDSGNRWEVRFPMAIFKIDRAPSGGDTPTS